MLTQISGKLAFWILLDLVRHQIWIFCAILKMKDGLTIASERALISPRKKSPRNAKNKRRGDLPVALGREYEVDIGEMSPNGEGIARVKSFTVFVCKARLGDHVKVKITRLGSVSADGEIVAQL